ncbi:hypothetical protein NQZ79_g5925 [Umbelopsis isabellina]|nr:hypothetical protein NQZ79_g5925 [Umbelopsis isabellina]
MSTSEFTANFEPLEVCGSGSFGVIRKVRRISDGQVRMKMILACKEIDYRKMSEKEKRQLVAEVNILRELKHPNIVRYYERIIDRKNCMLYILMEYCDGGDLSSVIRKCKQEGKYLQEEVIWVLFTQLLMALRECHHGKTGREESKEPIAILHRDLKPDNGRYHWMILELINETSYDIKSDLWALGCLTFELCALEPPFKAKTQMALAAKIKSGKTGSFPKQYSPQLYNMIKAMMHNNPTKRPTTLDFFKLEKIQRCRDSIEIKLLRTKIEQYERDQSEKQQRFEHRMAEIEKQERAFTTKLQKVTRREELVAQKERQILEKVQELSLHARQQEPESFQVPFHRGMSRSMSVQPSSRYTTSRLSMEAPSIVIPGRDTLCSSSPRSSNSARSISPLQNSADGSVSTASSSVSSLLFNNDDTAFYDAVTNLTLNHIPKPDKACHIQIQKINDIPSPFLRSA